MGRNQDSTQPTNGKKSTGEQLRDTTAGVLHSTSPNNAQGANKPVASSAQPNPGQKRQIHVQCDEDDTSTPTNTASKRGKESTGVQLRDKDDRSTPTNTASKRGKEGTGVQHRGKDDTSTPTNTASKKGKEGSGVQLRDKDDTSTPTNTASKKGEESSGVQVRDKDNTSNKDTKGLSSRKR